LALEYQILAMSFTKVLFQMSDEFAYLSDLKLLSLIKRVEGELEHRKKVSKDKVKEEIEGRIRKAGLKLGELFPEAAGSSHTRHE